MKKIVLAQKPTYIPSKHNEDIFDLFLQIEQEYDNCFLLESLGEEGNMSRYSILGFNPESIVSGKNNDKKYSMLRDIIPQDRIARNYAGGLVGFLGFDAINLFEPTLEVRSHPLFNQFVFGIYTDGVLFDKQTGELIYFYYNENRLPEIKRLLKTKVYKKKVVIKNIRQNTTKNEHKVMVKAVKEEIAAGNSFQTVVGMQTEFKINGDAVELYTRLRKVNPSPFMYYVKFGNTKIIGASPELLFGLRDREMQTFPLAGTVKRGKTEAEDRMLSSLLLRNKKEIAEHRMLVDLHRSDMGRVASFGSVKVRSFMDIKKFSHVQHISSGIAGLLKNGEDMFSGLASNFPAGTLTGAPKIESIKIINRLEKQPRGPYGGAVGHFGFNGDCTFAIPIRMLFINGSYGFTQAGSGIVADSDPENEYEEIERKLAAVREVLQNDK